MQQHNLPQGSPEWHAHRANHRNASDAPAMLGCSPYKTRAQLLRELQSGCGSEVDASKQRIFDNGHRFEALARPLGEQIIGEELYPVVGTEGKYSASFDGLTMEEDTAFEHKSLNDELRNCLILGCTGAALPKHYRVQMEQQCMVAGCSRVLFMASKWNGETLVEERHCWYEPDAELRAEIIAGWEQFERDLAAYVPPAAAPVVVAEPVQALPAVLVQVSGSITITDNFQKFEAALRDFLEHRLIREPKTDQDFADLDVQIKAMKGAEAALESAEANMLAQIATVDTAKKTKDMLAKLVRDNRLMAEKLLAGEKERRRGEIVAAGVSAMKAHIDGLNQRLGKPYMPMIPADFGGAVKGLKSLSSMEDKVSTELARAKIAAHEIADRIQINLNHLRDHTGDFKHLFPDTAAIVLKAPDDLATLVTARISEHRAAEEKRLEAERQRIREEEVAKLQREQEAAARAAAPAPTPAPVQVAPAPAANVVSIARPAAPPAAPTLRLGQINERLAPIQLSADGLASLGFSPAATEKAAKLYHEADFTRICEALITRIQAAQHPQQVA